MYRDTHAQSCSNNVCVPRYSCSVLVYGLCTEILMLFVLVYSLCTEIYMFYVVAIMSVY